MIVIPAIDLKEGRCVRMVEGRLGTERVVSPDAVAQGPQPPANPMAPPSQVVPGPGPAR